VGNKAGFWRVESPAAVGQTKSLGDLSNIF